MELEQDRVQWYCPTTRNNLLLGLILTEDTDGWHIKRNLLEKPLQMRCTNTRLNYSYIYLTTVTSCLKVKQTM